MPWPKGAVFACGGRPVAKGSLFFQPRCCLMSRRRCALPREETFGPVAPLFSFDTEERPWPWQTIPPMVWPPIFTAGCGAGMAGCRAVGIWHGGHQHRHHVFGISPVWWHEGIGYRPRGIQIWNRGVPGNQISVSGRPGVDRSGDTGRYTYTNLTDSETLDNRVFLFIVFTGCGNGSFLPEPKRKIVTSHRGSTPALFHVSNP